MSNKLFPQQRDEDRPRSVFGVNIISLTDLIGVILTFFILLYSTREPPVPPPPAQNPGQEAIAPVVTQHHYKPEGVLKPVLPGLDLNYVAALLRQAQARDPRLENIDIAVQPYAVTITLKDVSTTSLLHVLDKISLYRRTVAVFAPQATLAGLMDDVPPGSENMRFYAQPNGTVRILIH